VENLVLNQVDLHLEVVLFDLMQLQLLNDKNLIQFQMELLLDYKILFVVIVE